MSDSGKRFNFKSVVYGFLSFGFLLFLLSVCLVLKFTFFSKDFMLESMANSGYYEMTKDELCDELQDLGHASGLPDEFFDDFVRGLDMVEIERTYISAFYTGSSELVDTDKFKQSLIDAVNVYIDENNIDNKKADENSILHFVNEASSIYVKTVKIPFFEVLAKYIKNVDTPLTVAVIGIAAAVLAVAAIIFFTNRYKHRRYRYLTYGLGAGFLSVAVVPIVVYSSGIIPKINLATRSLYNLFVGYFNSLFMYFWIFAGILLFLSVIGFVVYRQKYLKAIGR